jgi:hypothetical protein
VADECARKALERIFLRKGRMEGGRLKHPVQSFEGQRFLCENRPTWAKSIKPLYSTMNLNTIFFLALELAKLP